MNLNRIQNEAHAIQEILISFMFLCRRASSQTCLLLVCQFIKISSDLFSLGTEHDGFGNSCNNTRIMAPDGGTGTEAFNRSPCSKESLQQPLR